MAAIQVGEFVVSQNLSLTFSRVSGDFNPLHTDPILARRYQFGSTVVHGVHATLKALDLYFEGIRKVVSLSSIRAVYSKPIRHGDVVNVMCSKRDSGDITLELYCRGSRSQLIKLRLSSDLPSEKSVVNRKHEGGEPGTSCPDLMFEGSLGQSGVVPLFWNNALMTEIFPALTRFVPAYQSCLLLGTTHIVGMHCPGLNSVYGSFDLSFCDTTDEFEQNLAYEVTQADSRFSRVIISLKHSVIHGEVEAFYRPRPVSQSAFMAIKSLVDPEQFLGQTALVVGGSRGLGEITSKLIAAGGGQVVLTYSSGQDDAEAIVEDVQKSGGQCEAVHYNVLSSGVAKPLVLGDRHFTHIYYFASPKIEKGRLSIWDSALFETFTEFYLAGLAKLLEYFVVDSAYRKHGVKLLLPSTEFLDNPADGFSEYVACKAAMESFASQFQDKHSSWRICTPRLPRLSTDQTASVVQASPIETAQTILAQLLKLDRDKHQ